MSERPSTKVEQDATAPEFDGHVDDALFRLKNSRDVMYVDPNGYSGRQATIGVTYIHHEAGRFTAITENLFGSRRGIVPERKVASFVRKHGCAFVAPAEVPDYVR
ncbi:hypothetical protein ACFPYI_01675 [Halomarina salina]|uniref:Uncharacterized protein n=1 Tax=Halomarina salina TaxID=1872699 RepID=A0ABD5RHG7_9EURY|nr:hypothetical protein [Halomarina salina]